MTGIQRIPAEQRGKILLCADKNDLLVKYTLPENNSTILASKYQLYLPTEKQLAEQLRIELQEFDQ